MLRQAMLERQSLLAERKETPIEEVRRVCKE